MSHDSIEYLVNLIKTNNLKEFQENFQLLPEDVTYFLDLLNENEKQIAIQCCREKEIYLLHRLFSCVTELNSIKFIDKNLEFYTSKHLNDDKQRTWLHTAVKFDRSKEILSYLINEVQIDVNKSDFNQYTALHIACQKSNYIPGELEILIKNSNQLIARSFDDVTPLELACGDNKKLKDIKRNKIVNINELLCHIDRINYGLPEIEEFYLNNKISTKRLWLNFLQKNDKHMLIFYMKKDPDFHTKYYLTTNEIMEIITHILENGHGILTYIKNKYIANNATIEIIFSALTGLKIQINTNTDTSDNEDVYYRSSLFLALISGRFELVPTLLKYCQFDIILYGLLTCLICHKLVEIQEFPDQVLLEIQKLKEFCETYSIAVLNRTVIRDLTPEKKTISGFLIKNEKLVGLRILDIAHLGKCSKFLSLPSCQETFTKQWIEKNRKCPAMKFYIHSIFHCLFLLLLSYVLVHDFYAKASIIEIICYIYGIGYLFEESRQIYIGYKENGFKSYFKEAPNYIDIGSIFTLILSVILRIFLPIQQFPNQGEIGLFMESKGFNLFFIRLILCISLILFYMRVIYFGSIFEQVGPKLKMIAKMIVQDLIPLIFIFIVFIGAFGIAFQSLMFPNSFYTIKGGNNTFEKRSFYEVIRHSIRRSTYTIFDTHYPFEELEHDEGGYVVNEEGKTAVYFLLIIYMVVVNIMLTNLLIALFSNTVTVIIQKSRESWKANRYKDIKEYFNRSMFPPPINILEIIIEIIVDYVEKKRSAKAKRFPLNEEEMQNLEMQSDAQKTQFLSFKIIQAFTLKDCRYKLVLKDEDKEYERRIEIKSIKKGIESIDKTLKENTKKKSMKN